MFRATYRLTILSLSIAAGITLRAAESSACSCAPDGSIELPAAGEELPPNGRIFGRGALGARDHFELTVEYVDPPTATITGTITEISYGQWQFAPATAFEPGRSVKASLRVRAGGPSVERTFAVGGAPDTTAPAAIDPTGVSLVRDDYAEVVGAPTSCDLILGPTRLLRFVSAGALAGTPGHLAELYVYPEGEAIGAPYLVGLGGFVVPTWFCAAPEPCDAPPGLPTVTIQAASVCLRTRIVDLAGNASPLSPERCSTPEERSHRYDLASHTCSAPEGDTGVFGCGAMDAGSALMLPLIGLLLALGRRRAAR